MKKSNQSGVATTNTAVRRGHEMECARGVARARDAVVAVADADAGDATTDVVGQDNASSRRITKLQWARLSERLERRVSFTCLSNRSSLLVSFV